MQILKDFNAQPRPCLFIWRPQPLQDYNSMEPVQFRRLWTKVTADLISQFKNIYHNLFNGFYENLAFQSYLGLFFILGSSSVSAWHPWKGAVILNELGRWIAMMRILDSWLSECSPCSPHSHFHQFFTSNALQRQAFFTPPTRVFHTSKLDYGNFLYKASWNLALDQIT